MNSHSSSWCARFLKEVFRCFVCESILSIWSCNAEVCDSFHLSTSWGSIWFQSLLGWHVIFWAKSLHSSSQYHGMPLDCCVPDRRGCWRTTLLQTDSRFIHKLVELVQTSMLMISSEFRGWTSEQYLLIWRVGTSLIPLVLASAKHAKSMSSRWLQMRFSERRCSVERLGGNIGWSPRRSLDNNTSAANSR